MDNNNRRSFSDGGRPFLFCTTVVAGQRVAVHGGLDPRRDVAVTDIFAYG